MQLITNKTSNLDSLYLGGAAMKDLFCTKAAMKSAIIAKQRAQRGDFFFFIDCSNFSSLRGKSGKSGRDLAPVVWNSYSPPRQRDRASLYWTSHWKYFQNEKKNSFVSTHFREELKYYFSIFSEKTGLPPQISNLFFWAKETLQGGWGFCASEAQAQASNVFFLQSGGGGGEPPAAKFCKK